MEPKQTTPSQENYIEWIYRFSHQGPIRPSQISEKVGVKRPSVTKAIDALVKKGLVKHEPFGCIELTEDGIALGKAIVRRDECLTNLLINILGMTPEEAAPEVHRLEHILSDQVLSRLEVLVGFASSSEAWLKRLHYRIDNSQSQPQDDHPFKAGCYALHQGAPKEKMK